MGFWKEIKHALNSTLGTNYFMPLNDIVNRELKASDTIYLTTEQYNKTISVSGGYQGPYYGNDEHDFKSVLVRCNGTCYIGLDGVFTGYGEYSYRSEYTFLITITHKNGSKEERSLVVNSLGDAANLSTLGKVSIPISAGDTLNFKLRSEFTNTDTFARDFIIQANLNIYAKEVPFSLLKINEV